MTLFSDLKAPFSWANTLMCVLEATQDANEKLWPENAEEILMHHGGYRNGEGWDQISEFHPVMSHLIKLFS